MFKYFLLVVCVAIVVFKENVARSPPRTTPPPLPDRTFCSQEKEQDDLDRTKMEGVWYVTHVTTTIPTAIRDLADAPTPIPCQIYKILKKDTISYELLAACGDSDLSYTEKYSIVSEKPSDDREKKEIMLSVIKTDYKVAAVITCEQSYSHNRVGRILSRTPEIDGAILDKVIAKLPEYGFETSSLDEVSQKNCGTVHKYIQVFIPHQIYF